MATTLRALCFLRIPFEFGKEYSEINANAFTLEGCREELEEILEEWLLLRISKNLSLPTVGGLELSIKDVA